MNHDDDDEGMHVNYEECLEELARVQGHVHDLLTDIGFDLSQPDLVDTPRRVARMYYEIFAGLNPRLEPKITVFPNPERYDSMVLVRDVPFYSMCSHHLIPFFGVGHIAYLPGEKIVGLSKLARVLEFFAKRPQVQERLTEQVADFLDEKVQPRGVMVVIEARHLCMEMRGVEKPGSLTVTSTHRGLFADSVVGGRYRHEFMEHIGRTASVPR
jgi:GTP cyclohydrolase I